MILPERIFMETEKFEIKEKLKLIKNLGLFAVLAFTLMFHVMLPLAVHFNIMVYSVVILIFSTILGAATFALYNLKGVVQADENGVNIRKSLFGKLLSEKSYKYSDIEKADCTVKKHNTKNFKYYEMIFVLIFSDGNKLCFSKRLKIQFNLDKKHLRSYQTAVAGEPMMQMYNFIMSNRTKAYYEKHP